ncbi:hypothetical protein [Synechococcus phage MA10]
MFPSQSFLQSFKAPTLAELLQMYQYRSGSAHAIEKLAVQQTLIARGNELVDMSAALQQITTAIDAGQTAVSVTVPVQISETVELDVTVNYELDVDYTLEVNISNNVAVDIDFEGVNINDQLDTFTVQADFAQDSRVSDLRHDYVRGQGYDSTHGNFWFRVEDDSENNIPIPYSGGQFYPNGFEEGGEYAFFAVEKGRHGLSVGDQLTNYSGPMAEAQARYIGGDQSSDVAYANNFDADELLAADPGFLNGFTLATVDMGTGEVLSLLNQHNHSTNWANALADQATQDIQVI